MAKLSVPRTCGDGPGDTPGRTGSIAAFIGLLAGKKKKAATVDEINEAVAQGWAGGVSDGGAEQHDRTP